MLSSGAITDGAPISEQVTLAQRQQSEYDLVSDAAQPVAFGGVLSAHVVVIFSDKKVMVTFTSADGASQNVPCDDTIQIISRTVPFTAISLTRVAAQETHVTVFVGQKA